MATVVRACDRSSLYERVPQAYRDNPEHFAGCLLPIERECLDRWLGGESYVAIGATLGVSSSRVGQRCHKAIRRIEHRIDPGVPTSVTHADRLREERIARSRYYTPAEAFKRAKQHLLQREFPGAVTRNTKGAWHFRARNKAGVVKVIESYDLAALASEIAAWDLDNVWD